MTNIASSAIPYSFLFVAVILWLSAAIGSKALQLLRVPAESLRCGERGTLSAALGVGILQFVPFTLALFGQMRPFSLRIALLILLCVLAPEMLRLGKCGCKLIHAKLSAHQTLGHRIWLVLLALYCGMLIPGALKVGPGGDDDGYHLTAPRRWLEQGRLAYLPTYSHTNSPMGFEMLYSIGLATCGPIGAKLLHLATGILCLITLGLLARRLGGVSAGIAAISLWLAPGPLNAGPGLFAYAFNDLAVCWMTAASFLAWICWRARPVAPLLIISMACAGICGSFKFTALLTPAVLLLLTLWEFRRNRVRLKESVPLLGTGLCAGLAPVLPWLGRNWVLTGNPVFPMFSGSFHSRDWSAENSRVFGLFFKYYNWGKGPGSAWSLGHRSEMVWICILAVLVGGAVIVFLDRRDRTKQLVAAISVMLIASIGTTGLYFRFWMPMMTLACAVAGSYFSRVAAIRKWGSIPALCVLAVGFALTARELKGSLPLDLRFAAGKISAADLYKEDPLWNTWQYLNSSTPKQSHILLGSFYTTFGASNGDAFLCDRACYVTDSHLQGSIRLENWNSFLETVRRYKITYLVVSDRQFAENRYGFEFPAERHEYPFCRRLADEFGEKIAQFDHLQVYRLNGRM